jgi:hypothetical protein
MAITGVRRHHTYSETTVRRVAFTHSIQSLYTVTENDAQGLMDGLRVLDARGDLTAEERADVEHAIGWFVQSGEWV